MTLFISNFRNLIFLFVGIISFESLIFFSTKGENAERHPPNFFEYAFAKNENRAKYIIAEKIYNFSKNEYNIIQVGGSAGLHAIDPRIVNENAETLSLFNANCCRNTGYDGYNHIANILLKKSKDPKILILYLSPLSIPTPGDNNIKTKLADQINTNYLSNKRFLNYIPSMRLRKRLTDHLYYFSPKKDISLDSTMTLKGWSSSELSERLYEQKGWLPFSFPRKDKEPFPGIPGNDYFSNSDIFFEQILKLNDIAQNFGASLWVVFSPWPYKYSIETKSFQEDINTFSLNNPDIHFPFEFITTWSKDFFTDEVHLNPKGAKKASIRLKKAILKKK